MERRQKDSIKERGVKEEVKVIEGVKEEEEVIEGVKESGQYNLT